MNYYLAVLKKYAVFSGRSRRKEFWMFTLISAVINTLLMYIDSFLGTNMILQTIYALAIFIPSIALLIRRLHDTNKSGWWILLFLTVIGGIVVFIFTVLDSDSGTNKYGPNPKHVDM